MTTPMITPNPAVRLFKPDERFVMYKKHNWQNHPPDPKALVIGTVQNGNRTNYLTVPLMVAEANSPTTFHFSERQGLQLEDMKMHEFFSMHR